MDDPGEPRWPAAAGRIGRATPIRGLAQPLPDNLVGEVLLVHVVLLVGC